MRTLSTINKHLDKNIPPWKCDEFQDELLDFFTKQEERTRHWYGLGVKSDEFDFSRKQDESKCTYSLKISGKTNILLHGYFTAQAKLFTENIEESNVKSEKRKKLIDARNKFYELLPNLLQNHKGKYVAIIEGNVEIDPDKDVLLDRVIKKYGYVSMYFDKVSDKRKVLRMSNRPRVRK